MRIWKPLVRFMKYKDRGETGWHTDFALEPGEKLEIIIAGKKHLLETCPAGEELKVHLDIAVEPEPL